MREMIKTDIGYLAPVNKDMIIRVDITPMLPAPTWKNVCEKITDYSDDMDETTEDYEYMCGDESSVESLKYVIGISGHTYYGDPAQKFIIDAKGKTGVGRRTNCQMIYPHGTIVEGPATLLDIITFGGSSKERMTFEASISMDGEGPNGKGTTTVIPEYSKLDSLPALPTPTFTQGTGGTASKIRFSFPDTTDANKAAQLKADLLDARANIMGAVSIPDPITDVAFEAVESAGPAGTIYIDLIFKERVTDVFSFLTLVCNGVLSKSMQQYEPQAFVLKK